MAVKILEKAKITDVNDVERVAREINILKTIRHPNIIQLYEIIETPKQLYLIMEYASGGELFEYIVNHQRVKELEACLFFQQIIAGVEYISKLNIVHRDLKPENLLLDHKKRIKIVDFGLSNTYKTGQLLKTACGSPCYAAPEMISGKRYNGTQVDIWSCGVILFAMICGYLPFEDSNTSMLYKKIISGDYKCPKYMSEEAKELVGKILNTNPAERFTIENIKNHKWFKLVNQDLHPGIFIGEDTICIENRILNLLEQYGVSSEVARKHIESNKHNHITTTYYLLLRKHKIQPIKESIDAPRPPNRIVPKVQLENIKLNEKTEKVQVRQANTSRSPIRPTVNLSPKPAVSVKSARNSVSPNRKVEEVKSYSGPYNVECISAKNPQELSRAFVAALDKMRILYRQNGMLFVCNRGSLKFNAEIFKIQGSLAVYLVKFIDNNSNPKDYKEAIEQILGMMNL